MTQPMPGMTKNHWITTKNSKQPTDTSFSPYDLHSFFARFEKPETISPTPADPNPSAPTLNVNDYAVVKQLNSLNSGKGAGPDGLIPKVIKLCADQLASSLQDH
jgi:hypothetical protein